MPPHQVPSASMPWPALLVCACLVTVLVVAFLVYAIAKAAINKADARDLPKVLAELAQMLSGILLPLHGAVYMARSSLSAGIEAAQSADTPQQTGGQSIGGTEAAQ